MMFGIVKPALCSIYLISQSLALAVGATSAGANELGGEEVQRFKAVYDKCASKPAAERELACKAFLDGFLYGSAVASSEPGIQGSTNTLLKGAAIDLPPGGGVILRSAEAGIGAEVILSPGSAVNVLQIPSDAAGGDMQLFPFEDGILMEAR